MEIAATCSRISEINSMPLNHRKQPRRFSTGSPASEPERIIRNWREHFFATLKSKYPNVHAVYLMTSVVSVWSGTWYFADTWSQGQDLMSPVHEVNLWVPVRHFSLLLVGLFMLYIDDKHLQELVLMKKTGPVEDTQSRSTRERVFNHFKTRYPNVMTVYTIFAIILSWCGTWGLLWDIPMSPFWRSLLTISIGFFMLYIDDLKLDEI